MFRLITLVCCIYLSGCYSLVAHEQPTINILEISKIELPVVNVFPSYKYEDENREFIQLSFSSNVEVISLSLQKNMTLKVKVASCINFDNGRNLAFSNVFLDGKSALDYYNQREFPKLSNSNVSTYQAYINFSDYKHFTENSSGDELCLNVTGKSYMSSFQSNTITIPDYRF